MAVVRVEQQLFGRVDGGVDLEAGAAVHTVEVDAPQVCPEKL